LESKDEVGNARDCGHGCCFFTIFLQEVAAEQAPAPSCTSKRRSRSGEGWINEQRHSAIFHTTNGARQAGARPFRHKWWKLL